MNNLNKFIIRNSKLVMFVSFFGAILLVFGLIFFSSQSEKKKMAELSKVYSNWVEATGKLKAYKALFPTSAESEVSDLPIPGTNSVAKQEIFLSSPSDTENYYLSAIVYSTSVESKNSDSKNDDLRKALDGVMGTLSGAKLISSRIDMPLDGPRSIEYVIQKASGDGFLKGRIMIVKDTMYQIWIDSGGQELDDKYKYFVNSFKPAE